MSKRNNKKKGKQEITQEQLHEMVEAWCADNEDGRAVMFVSLSESREAYLSVRGKRIKMIRLVREMILPYFMDSLGDWVITKPLSPSERAYGYPPTPRPSLWQRIRAWFFPFNIKK